MAIIWMVEGGKWVDNLSALLLGGFLVVQWLDFTPNHLNLPNLFPQLPPNSHPTPTLSIFKAILLPKPRLSPLSLSPPFSRVET